LFVFVIFIFFIENVFVSLFNLTIKTIIQMFKITTNKEIIEAIKTVEELKKVQAILKAQVSRKMGVSELCINYGVTGEESRMLNIKKGSYISAILSLYKMYIY
jgi:hypothetical protein